MTNLEILQAISPRFDYTVYLATCITSKIQPLPRGPWSQQMGMITAAEFEYPGIQIDKAYGEFIKKVNLEFDELKTQQEIAVKNRQKTQGTENCGTCGGGKVL